MRSTGYTMRCCVGCSVGERQKGDRIDLGS